MPRTYVDNAYNRSAGRVGLPVGSAVISKNTFGGINTKTYVDNAYNRQHGRVGMPHGSAVISKYSDEPVRWTYLDTDRKERLASHQGISIPSYSTSKYKDYESHRSEDVKHALRDLDIGDHHMQFPFRNETSIYNRGDRFGSNNNSRKPSNKYSIKSGGKPSKSSTDSDSVERLIGAEAVEELNQRQSDIAATSLFHSDLQGEYYHEIVMCRICQTDVECASITPCGHHFCTNCILQWLELNRSCPICKKRLREADLIRDRDFDRIVEQYKYDIKQLKTQLREVKGHSYSYSTLSGIPFSYDTVRISQNDMQDEIRKTEDLDKMQRRNGILQQQIDASVQHRTKQVEQQELKIKRYERLCSDKDEELAILRNFVLPENEDLIFRLQRQNRELAGDVAYEIIRPSPLLQAEELAVMCKEQINFPELCCDDIFEEAVRGQRGIDAQELEWGLEMPRTYVDNDFNRRFGRDGLLVGSAVISNNTVGGINTKSYADNAYNREHERVGMPHGSAVVSKYSDEPVKWTYLDTDRKDRPASPQGISFPSNPMSKHKDHESHRLEWGLEMPRKYVDNDKDRHTSPQGIKIPSNSTSKYKEHKSHRSEDVKYAWKDIHTGDHHTQYPSRDKTKVCNRGERFGSNNNSSSSSRKYSSKYGSKSKSEYSSKSSKYSDSVESWIDPAVVKELKQRKSVTDLQDEDFLEIVMCRICRTDVERASITPCGHHFCTHCILDWVERKRSCPTCKKRLREADLIQDRDFDRIVEQYKDEIKQLNTELREEKEQHKAEIKQLETQLREEKQQHKDEIKQLETQLREDKEDLDDMWRRNGIMQKQYKYDIKQLRTQLREVKEDLDEMWRRNCILQRQINAEEKNEIIRQSM